MRRPGATLEAVLDMMMEGLLIALLVFTPLAFGTVTTWALSLMQAGLVILFGAWLIRMIWTRPAARPASDLHRTNGAVTVLGYRFVRTGLGAPILVFVAIVMLQLVPVPRGLARALSPEAARTYERALPGYAGGRVDFAGLETWLTGADAGAVGRLLAAPGAIPLPTRLASSAARPLSIYPFATAGRLLTLLALLMAFLTAIHCLRSRPQIERICWVVTLLGLGLSVFGVVQRLQWNGKIYWFYPVTDDASPFGPFFNHNHFAAYLEMAMPLAFGMFLSRLAGLSAPADRTAALSADGGGEGPAPRSPESVSEADPGEEPRAPAASESVVASVLRRGPDPLARLGMSGFAAVVMLGALVLSGSRGALLSLGAAAAVYGAVMVVRGQAGRREWFVAAFVVAAAIGFSAWVGVEHLVEMKEKLQSVAEFETEPSLSARLVGWSYTLKIVRDFPLVGSGLGTFAEAWIHYYPPGTANVWKEAHNDYLQLAAETGIAGMGAFAWGLWIFLRHYLFRDLRRPPAAWAGDIHLHHGLAIGLLSILIHSWVDFSLQVAAIALLFVVLSAIMAGDTIRHQEAA